MKKSETKNVRVERGRALPFVIEFVKFVSAFAAIVAVSLVTLRITAVVQW